MEINIRPEVNILGVLRHLNYRPWYALAEFVDNALVSSLQNGLAKPGNPLRVSIDLFNEHGGRILIRDNAAGIPLADFPRAFRAAEIPPDRSSLSEFGMGMKTAASWFAQEWRVTTSVAGDPVERSVTFNIGEIEETKRDTIDVKEAPSNPESHFTTVELLRLNHVPQTKTIGKIRAHLSSIYRDFLRSSLLELQFRGDRLEFKEVDPLVATRAGEPGGRPIRWVKPIDFTLGDSHRVRGFAGLRSRGSTAEAGFALMRRGRLIVGSADETYRPTEIFGRSTTHTYQRLYGELDLEGFEVSHTKDGFRWDDLEDDFLNQLKIELSSGDLDLLSQASNYRLQPIADHRKPIEEAVSRVAVSVTDHFDAVAKRLLSQYVVEEPLPDVVETTVSETPSLAPISRQAKVELDNELWIIELEATLEDGVPDWIEVGAEIPISVPKGRLRETHVKVTVSLAHPFSRKFVGASNENAEMIMAFASTIGLALALGKRAGARSQSIITRINELARETFSMVVGTESTE